MSVVGPAELMAATQDSHGAAGRVIRADTLVTSDDGLLLVSGDSIAVYSRVNGHAGIVHSDAAPIYERKRMAAELRVMGFQPRQAKWRSWEGRVRVRGDSLEFTLTSAAPSVVRGSLPADTLRVHPRDLARVDLEKTDLVHSAGLIVVLVVVYAGIAVVSLALALNNSGFH